MKKSTYLKEWRESQGLTQEHVAAALGYKDRTGYTWLEKGKNAYTQSRIEAAAELFGCSPADILSVNPLEEDETSKALRWVKTAAPDHVRETILSFIEYHRDSIEKQTPPPSAD